MRRISRIQCNRVKYHYGHALYQRKQPLYNRATKGNRMIVHVNGWTGAGKQTVCRLLADQLGARFIHNHTLHDIAIACAGFDDPDRWPLYETVRAAAYSVLANRRISENFVMTNSLCKGSARECDAWTKIVDLAILRRVPLVPIVIVLDVEENCRRLQSTERVGRKLTDPSELKRYLGEDELLLPDVPELLVLDVTDLTANQASSRISMHLDTIRSSVRPASTAHLVLR